MTFADILANIEAALVDGNYSQAQIKNWTGEYKNDQYITKQDKPDAMFDGYVTNVFELCSFLRSVVGIDNGTEQTVILVATHIALGKANGGCKCCGRQFDQDDVFRVHGPLFAPGYCSARCYTKVVVGI